MPCCLQYLTFKHSNTLHRQGPRTLGCEIEGIVFTARALARRISECDALSDDAAGACELRRPHQIARALDAQTAIGFLRRRIARRARRTRKIGELMHDYIRPRRRDRLRQRLGIKHIDHDRDHVERAQHRNFGGATRGAGDFVPCSTQQGRKSLPDNSGRPCQENSH